MKTTASPTIQPAAAGFTLIELLTVIAIISLLAALLLPVMAKAKSKAQQIQCLNNMRNLGMGWVMYSDDNAGKLVPHFAGGSDTGKIPYTASWVGGWMNFGTDLGDNKMDNVEVALLLGGTDRPYCGFLGDYVKNPAVFKCPGDKSQINVFGRLHNRIRSISMNYYMNARPPDSVLFRGPNSQIFRNFASIVEPAKRFVLIDEREDSINDGTFEMDPEDLINGHTTIVDYPASYHHEGGGLNFADGHSEIKTWRDPRTKPPLKSGTLIPLMVSSAGNQDIEWIKERTTVPK